MTRRNNHHLDAAIGLYASAGSWHLVKLQRADAGFRVALEHSVSHSQTGDAHGDINRLVSRLEPEDRGLPLGLALAEHGGMYRRIPAPPADKILLDKVVAAQVETMLPGRADQVRYGWCLTHDQKDIWVHAIARPDIDTALAPFPDDFRPTSVISDTMALASALLSNQSTPQSATLTLSVGPRHSDLALIDQGAIRGVVSCDSGSDDVPRDSAARTDWMNWLSDARYELFGALPSDRQPKRCLLACQPQVRDQLIAACHQATGLDIDIWRESGGIKLQSISDPSSVIAARAAAVCLDPVVPAIALQERSERSVFNQQITRYAAIAAVWLLVGLLALYVSDRIRAGHANDLLTGGALDGARLLQIDRQIQMARKLELSGPIPLAIIDEIGQKVPGFMFDDLAYERGGTVRIGGLQPSAEAVGTLMQNLADMKTLSAVQLQSQRGDGDNIRYEITAQTSPKFFGAFIKPEPQDEDKTKESTG